MGLTAIVLQPLNDLFVGVATVVLFFLVALPSLVVTVVKSGPRSLSRTYGIYEAMESWPFGKWIFTRLVGFFAPYSGSIGATVLEMSPGTCEMYMTDRPWKRNPFSSLHAVALANLAEMTSGLACMTAFEAVKGAIGIPVSMSIDYIAKARGTCYCRSSLPKVIPSTPGVYPMMISCDVFDESGVVCAKAMVGWSFKVRESKKKA